MDTKLVIALIIGLMLGVLVWTQLGKAPVAKKRIEPRRRKVKPALVRNHDGMKTVGENAGETSAIKKLFKISSSEFSDFHVLLKNEKVLICEKDGARSEPRELVFISLNPLAQKSIKQSGAYIVAVYRSVPTGAEMRRDFAPILNKYR